MGFKNSLKNTIPNPFSKQSSLSSLEKTRELIRGGSDSLAGIIYIVFLLIIALVLVRYIRVPASVVAILIGAEILITLVGIYIKTTKIKSLYGIGTQDIARSYRTILITSEYYGWIEAVIGLIASSMSVFLVLVFFSKDIMSFIIENIPPYFRINPELFKYFVLIFFVVRLFKFVIRLLKYNWIRNIRESDDFAQVNQERLLIEIKLAVIIGLFWGCVVLIIVLSLDIPSYIPLIVTTSIFLMLVLSVVSFLRIKNIEFDNKAIDTSVVQHKIEEYPEEQIIGTVFGIMRMAASIKEYFGSFSFPLLGSGKRHFPENTLLVTNNRLLFIQIPISGGDKIVGGTDYVTTNYLHNRAELRQRGEEILKTNSLSQILNLATNDVLYTDIKTLTLKRGQIFVEKFTGQKLVYIFRDREYVVSLKQLFRSTLKERFMEMC